MTGPKLISGLATVLVVVVLLCLIALAIYGTVQVI